MTIFEVSPKDPAQGVQFIVPTDGQQFEYWHRPLGKAPVRLPPGDFLIPFGDSVFMMPTGSDMLETDEPTPFIVESPCH